MNAVLGTPVHHEDSARGRLMKAAIALFARKGYASTTVREIVAAAGVTKPVLYYHFGNKEGIFRTMMQDALAEYELTVAAALGPGGTARDRVLRFLDGVMRLILEHLDVMRVVDAVYYGPPGGSPSFDFEAIHGRFKDTLVGLVREGIEAGEFKAGDPEDVAWALVGPFEVARGMSLCHPELDFGRARLARLVEIVFDGVCIDCEKELGR